MPDALTVSTGCDNGLGIHASEAADGSRYFSVEEASRLAGVDPSSGHRRWKELAVRLVGPDGRARKYVPAEVVDAERERRRSTLGLFEQRADTSDRTSAVPFVSAAGQMESIVRDLLVAEDLAAEALELERRRNDIYRNVVRQLMPSTRDFDREPRHEAVQPGAPTTAE